MKPLPTLKMINFVCFIIWIYLIHWKTFFYSFFQAQVFSKRESDLLDDWGIWLRWSPGSLRLASRWRARRWPCPWRNAGSRSSGAPRGAVSADNARAHKATWRRPKPFFCRHGRPLHRHNRHSRTAFPARHSGCNGIECWKAFLRSKYSYYCILLQCMQYDTI